MLHRADCSVMRLMLMDRCSYATSFDLECIAVRKELLGGWNMLQEPPVAAECDVAGASEQLLERMLAPFCGVLVLGGLLLLKIVATRLQFLAVWNRDRVGLANVDYLLCMFDALFCRFVSLPGLVLWLGWAHTDVALSSKIADLLIRFSSMLPLTQLG
ncbi:hypothetical protein Nepgr_018797 [Nepenthes gracilis]|uniref:Uncharacterized protein n=1 Tax=Nepenthes gracilis TaxID=150966 RepID=A0AAD3SVW2_NEPGR|nr:hypothetical protein Nepgr_018797 [Nepenthes gracilis]